MLALTMLGDGSEGTTTDDRGIEAGVAESAEMTEVAAGRLEGTCIP